MKHILLLCAAFSVALSTFAVAESATNEPYDDPEMYLDLIDSRMQEVEWVLENNPMLMQKAVSDTLRANPGVVQEIIRDTLLRNPEIIIDSLQEFQRKQQPDGAKPSSAGPDTPLSAEFLADVRRSDDAPVRGNPDGTVTIVEFADYNCGYCRRFGPTLNDLIAKNPNLRVVHREWPILSSDSVEVAKIALAAQEQNAYEVLHKAFMSTKGSITPERALEIAKELGLDIEKLEADAQNPIYWGHIQRSADLAKQVKLAGTPGIVIGDTLARGLVSAKQIQPILDRLSID